MNDTKIKICGLKTPADIESVNRFGADFIGFVFVEGRKRYIAPSYAKTLRAQVKDGIKVCGVFADEDKSKVIAIAEEVGLDYIQLHGEEDDEYIAYVKRHCDIPVIKAFTPQSAADIITFENCPADLLLYDSGQGSGKVFGWEILKDSKRPFLLAGGLNPDNCTKALAIHPYGLDVSSGVETDGVKDPAKIEKFIKNVRGYTDEH